MRVGIFGGTFDPVHFGHLLLAECCREQCALDEVWFLPAATAPHKPSATATARARIEMLELALAGAEAFRVCPLEIERGGVSYTVETLAELHRQHTGAELFLLLGGDMARDLPNWREPARVCELACPVFVRRADFAEPDWQALAGLVSPDRLKAIRACQVEMPLVQISSSNLRQRLAAGQGIRYRTPRAVEEYIAGHQLYGAPVSRQPQ